MTNSQITQQESPFLKLYWSTMSLLTPSYFVTIYADNRAQSGEHLPKWNTLLTFIQNIPQIIITIIELDCLVMLILRMHPIHMHLAYQL
mmetsp:Transcript_12671/g.23989  ORF Transcript_12671/g.23989 Transcript_12671/m.23989 type:complete len:89 (+) Transcript_12671:26-292(+)